MPTTTDPIADLSAELIIQFARDFHQALGVDDAYETDDERLFSLLVEVAKVYVTRGAGGPTRTLAEGATLRTNIDCTADALVENLDVVFSTVLGR